MRLSRRTSVLSAAVFAALVMAPIAAAPTMAASDAPPGTAPITQVAGTPFVAHSFDMGALSQAKGRMLSGAMPQASPAPRSGDIKVTVVTAQLADQSVAQVDGINLAAVTDSKLGYPTSNELASAGCGVVQSFQGGAILYSPKTGAHVSTGAIRAAYVVSGETGGLLGYSATEEIPASNSGMIQRYQGGIITWTSKTGAHTLHGAIGSLWLAKGADKGTLGYPTTDEYVLPGGGVAQDFQAGRIIYTPQTGALIGK